MNKYLNKIISICNCIMEYIFISSIIITLSTGYSKDTTFYFLLYIPVCIIATYFFKQKVHNLIVFLIGNAILFGASFLVPANNISRFILCFYIIINLGRGLYFWQHEQVETVDVPKASFPIFLLIVFVILYTLSYMLHSSSSNVIYCLSICFLFVHFVKLYVSNIKSFIIMNSASSTSSALKRGLLSNSFFLIFVIAIILLSVILSSIFHIDNFLYSILDILSYIGKAIITGVLYIWSQFAKLMQIPSPEPFQEVAEEFKETTPNMLLDTLLNILSTLAKLAIVFIILRMAYTIIHKFIKKYMNRKYYNLEDIDIHSYAADDIIDTDEPNTSIFKRLFDRSNTSKIRRIYKRRIKKACPISPIKSSMTHTDIEHIISEQTENDIHALTNIYELARYSSKDITKVLVQEAKQS